MSGPTTSADELVAGVAAHLAAARELRLSIAAPGGRPSFDRTVRPYHELTLHLANASHRASFFAAVHPDAAVRRAAEACVRRCAEQEGGLVRDVELHRALAAVDAGGLPPDAQRFLQLVLRDFERAGVGLDAAARARLGELEALQVRLAQDFVRNLEQDARSVVLAPRQLVGLSEAFRAAHPPGVDGAVVLSGRWSDSLPFLASARDEPARRAVFEAFANLGWPANGPVLEQLLAARAEAARLLGFRDHADYQTATAMTGSGKGVQAFIDWLATATEELAADEQAVLLERVRRDVPSATFVGAWQKDLYLGLLARERAALGPPDPGPCSERERPLDVLFALSAALFGLEFRPVSEAARWHESVEVYDVFEGPAQAGRFFVDLEPRPGKLPGGALRTLVPGVAGHQLPELALVGSVPTAVRGPESLRFLSHEFGHLLQKLFSARQRFLRLAGGADEPDFIEVPSLVLEELVPELGAPGRPQPDRPRAFGRALHVRADLVYQSLALWCHQTLPDGADATGLLVEAYRRYGPFPYVEGTHQQASFRHLPAYGACYYTYLWSRVLACDLVGEWRRRSVRDPAVARRFRDAVLAPGASKPAAAQVLGFLGREPRREAFLAWLRS